ncbi:MAG: ABC transporter ATP-binding protein [Epsilonproteobacteria bacterium]|nr:ABC transporter ATP-binding protein [Campylobacterota bacterium]
MSFKCKRLLIKNGDSVIVDISFEIEKAYALVGQSGSGKSLSIKAILGMLPSNLESESEFEWSYELQRGKSVVMVPQNPFTSLSPLNKIKDNFFIDENEMKKLLNMVGLEENIADRFPSELSGGQLQRAIIAIAISHKPKLLLLDEPTTALDSDTKDKILSLFKELQQIYGFEILFVTHDINSSRIICDKIGIIHNGKIIEEGDIEDILENPQNEYTKKLIESNFKNREFRS